MTTLRHDTSDTTRSAGIAVRDARTTAVVAALVEGGLVEPARRPQATTVVDEVLAGQGAASPARRRAAELAGYLGGALVVAAAGIVVVSEWDTLSLAGRSGLLAGITVALGVAGVVLATRVGSGRDAVRRGTEAVRHRLASALLTGAALTAGGAVGIAVEAATGSGIDDVWPVVVGFATLLVASLLGYRLAPTVLGQLGAAVGAAVGLATAVARLSDGSTLVTSLSVLLVGVGWLLAAEGGRWREVAPARVIGCTLVVTSAQVAVLGAATWPGYLLLALVATAAFATYAVRPARPYLAAGVVSVTLVVPEALLDWTDDAIGPAGALLVAGLALIGASMLGLRLRRDATGATGASG